jgi:hypothetical protein
MTTLDLTFTSCAPTTSHPQRASDGSNVGPVSASWTGTTTTWNTLSVDDPCDGYDSVTTFTGAGDGPSGIYGTVTSADGRTFDYHLSLDSNMAYLPGTQTRTMAYRHQTGNNCPPNPPDTSEVTQLTSFVPHDYPPQIQGTYTTDNPPSSDGFGVPDLTGTPPSSDNRVLGDSPRTLLCNLVHRRWGGPVRKN